MWTVIVFSLCNWGQEPSNLLQSDPAGEESSRAAARGLRFVEKEGVLWIKRKQCVSCHHVPMMIWTLSEAHTQGYGIDEQALNDAISWSLSEKPKLFRPFTLPKKPAEPDYLGPLHLALSLSFATRQGRRLDASLEGGYQRLLSQVLIPQESSGSWEANKGGRLPIHGTKEIQTSFFWLSLDPPASEKALDPSWKERRERAAKWLTQDQHDDAPPSLSIRLLLSLRSGRSSADCKKTAIALLKRQNDDGGWSQMEGMKSDAFATGQAVYSLCGSGEGADASIQKARRFLIETQREDGSWPMASRPSEAQPEPSKDLAPITYAGTAWATLGLVRASSRSPVKASSEKKNALKRE